MVNLGAFATSVLLNPVFAADAAPAVKTEPVTIFTAKKVITMEPGLTGATAVAVAEGRIVGVGSEQELNVWIEQRGGKVEVHLEDAQPISVSKILRDHSSFT